MKTINTQAYLVKRIPHNPLNEVFAKIEIYSRQAFSVVIQNGRVLRKLLPQWTNVCRIKAV